MKSRQNDATQIDFPTGMLIAIFKCFRKILLTEKSSFLLQTKGPYLYLIFCHSHSHSHSHCALCNVYPVALDRNRR